MKCKRCDGDGVIIYYDYQYADKEVCPDCDGNGVVEPLTEQEWLQTADTEQLAEWIASVVQKAISIKENNGIVMLESAIWWDEWLKQPHNTKE